MPTDCISYQNSGYFIPLMNDYLDQKKHLQSLYNRFPSLENFKEQIAEKQANYPDSSRALLFSVLKNQYAALSTSDLTIANINALKDPNTFTVTTGHQLNLFTGPLYFLYKIISTINLTNELKIAYPDNNFVPIYWMATEDHDFEEINYFNFKGKKFRWNKESFGPVGRLSTEGLDEVLEKFKQDLGIGKNGEELKQLFEEAYLKHDNLASATRFLADKLFGAYGLVILDADDIELKRLLIPYIKEELLHQTSHQKVAETSALLAAYKIQVNPREINLFYIKDDLRERIILEPTHPYQKEGIYKVNNSEIKFTEKELLQELEDHPEKFSPNVIIRPLYQEVILPNLCYIGGGGELAYWLELKSYFDASKITFPVLLLRNSVLLATEKQAKKADKLELHWSDLFLNQFALKDKIVKRASEFKLDFSAQKTFLQAQFDTLREIAKQTDASFIGAVNAQETKQIKGLDHLEKRLIKAEKKQHEEELNRITDLQNELFPNQGLQERSANFSEFYLESGSELIDKLFATLKPLEHQFEVLVV
jgi:bacillithiol biosynthesis cysteine-adding enzyme BshC